MRNEKHIHNINELAKISEVIDWAIESNNEPFRSFGLANSNISFIGLDKISKLNLYIEDLYNSSKEISEYWAVKNFEKDYVNLIRTIKFENRSCSQSDLDALLTKFINAPIQESEIFYELYGAEMSAPKLELGDFTVYNFDLSFSELTERYPYLIPQELYFSNRKSDYLVGIKVKSKDDDKSVEIADNYCEIFENVFSYMIADLKHERTVGIFNFRGWKVTRIVICNNDSSGSQGRADIWLPVKIDEPFFVDSSQGNDKIWKLITKPNKSEIEYRILNSIEWVGKAIYDLDKPKSLIQFVFAIEGLLQQNEKSLITPSIVSQISDWLAFITNDELEPRKLISKYFKDIYQKRSAIAHGAKKQIQIEDLSLALQISKLLIISLLTNKPFCDFKSIDELNKYIVDLKYK